MFLYRDENLLERQGPFYATSFAHRKRIAQNLVVALAESQVTGSVGLLLLSQRNLNIAPDLTVYLNYFLDFQKWDPDTEDSQFYRYAAQAVFQILSQEYELRSEGQFDSYPSELQAFYKKAETKGFLSHSAILAALKAMPDRPIELRVGVRRLAGRAGDLLEWVKKTQHGHFRGGPGPRDRHLCGLPDHPAALLPERSGKKTPPTRDFPTSGTSRSAMRQFKRGEAGQ